MALAVIGKIHTEYVSRSFEGSGAMEAKSDMKVYHIHLRKTGGTALRYLLERVLKPSNQLPYYSDCEFFENVPPRDQTAILAASDLVSGHFGLVGQLVPNEFSRICVLRDPLRRVVSDYNHILYDADDPLHSLTVGRTFCDAVCDSALASELWNHQARLIVQNCGEDFERLTTRQRVECCIAFLSERVDCLGVIEHPAQLVSSLGRTLGTEILCPLENANSEITAGGVAKSAIYECLYDTTLRNSIDWAIYSYTVARLGF
jgi:hypothetical protein